MKPMTGGYGRGGNLAEEVEAYLDMIVRGGLLFSQGIKFYLEGRGDEFGQRLEILAKLENKADVQLKSLEGLLFYNREEREWRGDILGLIENTDDVINGMQKTLKEFSAENPAIPPVLHDAFKELGDLSSRAVELMVAALRAYFRNHKMVRRHIEQVMLLKGSTLKAAERLKRRIFGFDIELDHKFHLGYFAHKIEEIAEMAENVCDRLAIATIKRYSS